ncbi:sulfite exporter TauE/SafE family protein [Saccharospirillum impatiens]|uniref:sulfite exporter TauE/SafE family protein n=1 Tax=Saccharospirillum impatiens TaxID=169438 RepID=UPI0006846B63|nr:sulfite exporter TauE/SafE family protein [Saccharospirillum impatiens]
MISTTRIFPLEILDQYSLSWIVGLVLALSVTGIIAGLMAGLLGVGGGIVIVPVLYHLFTLLGVDESVKMHVAVGTSLATIIPTSLRSARAHANKGNLDSALLKSLAPSLLVGVFIGTLVSSMVTGQVLSLVFGVIGLIVAANMAIGKEPVALAETLPKGIVRHSLGTGIGGFSTLMGIGGGTLSVPVLSRFQVPMHRAVGTAAAIGIFISIPGALGFLINGWGVADRPPFSLGYVNLIGFALIVPMTLWTAPLGARIAHAINARLLRQLFAVFLLITAVRMLYGVFV